MDDRCNAKIQGTLGGTFEIVSHVQSKVGDCRVDTLLSASHVIEITNWTNWSFSVDICGECQTPYVGYQGTNGPQQTWEQKSLVVRTKPGSGGPSESVASQPLTSLDPALNQSIRTDLTWFAFSGDKRSNDTRKASLGMQVDTL